MAQILYSYTFLDSRGKKTAAAYFGSTPEAQTLSNLHDDWIALGSILESITAAKITNGQVKIGFAQDVAWKDTPVDGSNISEAMLFDFVLNGIVYRQSYLVPAPADAALDASNKIDLTDAGVKAFINGMVSGWGVGTAVVGMGKFGQDITGFLGCRTTDRTHRRQATMKTYVDGANYVP